MEFTGERYVPELEAPEISYEHWHRYLYASQFAKGKVVLDIACGEGYGSYLLARTAKRVVGVDNSQEAINHASSMYITHNLEFQLGIASSIPLKGTNVFDMIVSFETIEHLKQEDQVLFLDEAKRLLRAEGVLIISTPNKVLYSMIPKYHNVFHLREFYAQQFKEFLEGYFKRVNLLGQKIYPGSYIWDSEDREKRLVEYKLQFHAQGFRPSDEPKAMRYLVAICSDVDLKRINSSILIDLSERLLATRDQTIEKLQTQQVQLQQKQDQLQQQLTEKEQALQTLEGQQIQLQQKQDQLQQQLTEKEQALQTLEGQQIQLQQKQNQLRQQLTEKEQAVQAQQTRITELETQLTVLRTGLAFLLLSKYRSTLNHLLPNGTRRRRLYTLLTKVGRVLLDEGCQGFWSRIRHRLGRRFSKLPAELPHRKSPESEKVLETMRSVWMPQIQLDRPLSLPHCRLAVITVVVVATGPENAYRCLAALASHLSRYDFEVIVVADGADDRTANLLTSTTGIKIVENATRLGFAVSCNRAAAMAQGRYLLLLRDNVVLQPGCLNELVETDVAQENCVMVGPKLVTPNHTVWAAGGLLGSDGSISRLGAGEDPASPAYSYLRIVDFCTSAILVTKSLFEQVGGFDKKFEACAEVDLALALQEHAQRVYYQPLARAVLVPRTSHAGNERGPFIRKWGKRLTEQGPTESGVGPRCRVLFIDTCTPTPDKDGGSVYAFNQMRALTAIGCQVTFAPSADFTFTEKYTPALQRIGIRCVYPPYVSSLDEYIVQHGEGYNIVFLSRVNNATYYIDKVRKYCPVAKVVFNTVDLHYLREMRRAEIEDSEDLMRGARELRRIEVNAIRKADCTVVISSKEKELLQSEWPEANIFHYHLITDIRDREQVPFAERKDIFFIGSYKHLPNVDAVHYFVEDVWPLIRSCIPGIRFYIIGSYPTRKMLHLASDDVVVTGYIEDIASFFNRCRVSVAPLRYGAGVKEKVIRSLGYALPVVATSIATEGTGLVDGENVLVRDDAAAFSDAVVRVYQSEELWRDLSEHGLAFFKKNHSPEAGRHTLNRLIREVTQDHRMNAGKKR